MEEGNEGRGKEREELLLGDIFFLVIFLCGN